MVIHIPTQEPGISTAAAGREANTAGGVDPGCRQLHLEWRSAGATARSARPCTGVHLFLLRATSTVLAAGQLLMVRIPAGRSDAFKRKGRPSGVMILDQDFSECSQPLCRAGG